MPDCPRCGTPLAQEKDGRWGCTTCPGTQVPADDTDAVASGRTDTPVSFGRAFLYGVLTLGIYFIYYNYAAFEEVDRRAGRRHLTWLFAVALLALVAAFLLALAEAERRGADHLDPLGAAAITAMVSFVLWAVYLYVEVARLRRDAPTEVMHPAILPIIIMVSMLLEIGDVPRWVHLMLLLFVELPAWFFLHASINAWWEQQGHVGTKESTASDGAEGPEGPDGLEGPAPAPTATS